MLDQEVQQTARLHRTSMMRLAYYGWRLRFEIDSRGGDWSVLGVPYETTDEFGNQDKRFAASEDEYRDSLGVSRSNWYKYLSIGAALHKLTLPELERITMTNAELLIQVDPVLWGDFPWIREATELTSNEFALRVVERNRQHGSDREPMTYYRCKVQFTAKKFLEETVEKFRLDNGLATAGEALELLVADVHDRPNVMTAVRRSMNLVNWAMWRFRKKRDSTEVQWLYRAERLLYKAYWAVRMERAGGVHEENAKEVYPAESEQDRQDYAEWSRDLSEQPGWPNGAQGASNAGVASAGRRL